MSYIHLSKMLKTNIAKIFIAVAAISISETKATAAALTDLDRNLDDTGRRKACGSTPAAPFQKSCPIEDKKTTPVSTSFWGGFFRYISTFPPVFNMYTPAYKSRMSRMKAMDRKYVR